MKEDRTHMRGFASMNPKRLKEVTSMGGKVSPSNFANNRKLASTAGRKGGLKSRRGIINHDN